MGAPSRGNGAMLLWGLLWRDWISRGSWASDPGYWEGVRGPQPHRRGTSVGDEFAKTCVLMFDCSLGGSQGDIQLLFDVGCLEQGYEGVMDPDGLSCRQPPHVDEVDPEDTFHMQRRHRGEVLDVEETSAAEPTASVAW